MKWKWKIASTHERIKDYLNKTCKFKEEQAQVRGKDGKATEEYTKDLVDAIVQCPLEEKVRAKPMKKTYEQRGVGKTSKNWPQSL